MKARGFFIAVLAGVLICFGGLMLLLAAEDPFFVLSGVEDGETAVFDEQRYQMAGLIRHQEYESVVMGTSLAANFRASWFTEETGEETLKITFPDGWVSEFDRALTLAYGVKGELSTVYFCMDPNIIVRPDSERTVEMPDYLYNMNPLDDAQYWLSADTYERALKSRLAGEGEKLTLDEAYIWDGSHTFSWAWAKAGYPRPEISGAELPADAYLAAAEENLDVICGWAETHPDTEFVIWLPPYSILYWDKMLREGSADAVLAAVEYAVERLSEQENIQVYDFLTVKEIVCNLNYYTDHIHHSGEIGRYVTQSVAEGTHLAGEDFPAALEQWRDFVYGYDFTMIFPET